MKGTQENMKSITIGLCVAAVASALAGFGGIRAMDHDNYGGSTNSWQMKRHWQKMETVTNGGAKVVFVGDSITHGWDGSKQQTRHFSKGDRKMLNLGTAGDATRHVLWRINEGGELDGYEAKCVVLMIGTNNDGHDPMVDTVLAIREIVRTIRAKQPKAALVLHPIFPKGAQPDDPGRVRSEAINKLIENFADDIDVFWCDFNDQLLMPDGRLSPESFPDYLHPSGRARDIWYAAIKPYVDAALSDGRIPMPPSRYSTRFRNVRTPDERVLTTFASPRIDRWNYGRDWWLDRVERNRNLIADSKSRRFDVVLVGDALASNWETVGKESYARLCKAYSVLNAGYSGDTTGNVLWRMRDGGELEGYGAKCVVLAVGKNNTMNAWRPGDSAEDVAAGVRAIIAEIAKKQPGAKVALLPILPVGDSPKDARRVANDKANACLKGIADGKKVFWIDFSQKLLDAKGDVVAMMPDRVHPNAKAYEEVILPALLPFFKSACGK